MAITGGKSRFGKPVAFKNAIVSIGDFATNAYVASIINESVVLGSGAKALRTAQYCVVVGENASSEGLTDPATPSNSNVVIGRNSLASGVVDCVVVGESAYADLGSDRSVALGKGCFSTFSSTDAVAISPDTGSILNPNSVFIGSLYGGFGFRFGSSGTVGLGNTYSLSSTDSVVLGNAQVLGSTQTVVVGFAIASAGTEAVVIGDEAFADNEYGGVIIGASARSEIGTGIAIGHGAAHNGSSSSGIIIGHDAQTLGSETAIVIGTRASVSGGTGTIVVGTDSSAAFSDWAVVIGHGVNVAYAITTVAIGTDIKAGDYDTLLSASTSVLIGSHITSLADNTLLIGTGSIDENSPRAQVIGRDVTIVNSNTVFVVGYGTVTVTDSPSCTVMGFDTTIDNAPYSVALGYGNIIDDPSIADLSITGAHIAVGGTNQLLGSTYGSSVLGRSNILSESSYSVIAGTENVVRNANFAAVLGHENNIPTGNDADYALLIGVDLEVTAPYSITMGAHATNSEANTMVIGTSGHFPPGVAAIHSFVVKGNNPSGAVDTIAVNDSPGLAGETGLSLVCQLAGVGSNKTVLADAAPAPGSLYLYILP